MEGDNCTGNLCPHLTYNVSAVACEEDKLCANSFVVSGLASSKVSSACSMLIKESAEVTPWSIQPKMDRTVSSCVYGNVNVKSALNNWHER